MVLYHFLVRATIEMARHKTRILETRGLYYPLTTNSCTPRHITSCKYARINKIKIDTVYDKNYFSANQTCTFHYKIRIKLEKGEQKYIPFTT